MIASSSNESVASDKSSKISNSITFEINKDDEFDIWLSLMKSKLEFNSDWYLIEVNKMIYIQSRLKSEVMKIVAFWFRQNSFKSLLIVEEILVDLERAFDDSDKKFICFFEFVKLKQTRKFKKFQTFRAEFQRLFSELSYSENALLAELRRKISFEIQRMLTLETYRVIDIYAFTRLCIHRERFLHDVDNQTKTTEFDELMQNLHHDHQKQVSISTQSLLRSNQSRFQVRIFLHLRLHLDELKSY